MEAPIASFHGSPSGQLRLPGEGLGSVGQEDLEKEAKSERNLLLDPAFPYGEDLLQFMWESRLFDRDALRTTDGRSVEVVHPGRIQRNSGPDLDEALIRIDGQLWSGTVEVHLKASEWNAHGHQHDPAYDNVVLHVVHTHDMDVHTANGTIPPAVELGPRIDVASIRSYHALMRSEAHIPCAGRIKAVEQVRIRSWLDRVLVERLERKTGAVEAIHKQLEGDVMVTFHHMLLRGFGAHVNAEPFGMLAHALPLKFLLKYRDDHLRTEALLFGQAGLLRTDFADEHPRRLQAEHRLLAHMHDLGQVPLSAWKFGRMRPANFPTVRIAQLARLIAKCDGSFDALLQHDDPEPLRDLLDVEAGCYWHDHFRFDVPAERAPKRLGRSAADGLIINTIVPFLFAMGRIQGNPSYTDRALELLERLPPERNAITTEWREVGIQAGNAAQSQALIELKNGHCTPRKCLFCGIGRQLLKQP